MLVPNDSNPSNGSPLARSSSRSPRSRRRWRRSGVGTAVIAVLALLISTTAWLSLVFSSTTSRALHRLSAGGRPPSPPPKSPEAAAVLAVAQFHNRSLSVTASEELGLNHIVFGIAGSSNLWRRRKEFIRLWWRPEEMRGHVWLEEKVGSESGDESLPPVMVSEDISSFRYTNPTGHPSGLRISRIVIETIRLGLSDVRWFVLGDDDTIFDVDNLVAVLRKYNWDEMVYIGSPSESHSANTYFSHNMAFGGGGIAISRPLAEALAGFHDECLERYPKLYGSDDRLHACITELGVPLTREHGFHQWDIRGSAHGLLSTHPISPFVSVHHVDAVDPIYPGLNSLESLKLFTKAMKMDSMSFLQRSIFYDHARRLTFLVSLGYVVQVFPNIVLPRELERSERTYSAWNRLSNRHEFDHDTRDPYKSVCKRPVLFFLKDVRKEGNATLGTYVRLRKDDFKRKVFCFPRLPPLPHVQNIEVLSHPLSRNWHLVPRRLCCKLNQASDEHLRFTVKQCEKGVLGSATVSMRS